jgi:hypothetical protein
MLQRIATIIVALGLFLGFCFSPFGIIVAAWIGYETGWYRIEDHMCDDQRGCERGTKPAIVPNKTSH